MREIKFRAWDSTLGVGRMAMWEELSQFPCYAVFIGAPLEVILEQFTGLKDKNGVDIYEGDIVKGVALCDFEYGEAGWSDKNSVSFNAGRFYIKGYLSVLDWHQVTVEVLGNIHQGVIK